MKLYDEGLQVEIEKMQDGKEIFIGCGEESGFDIWKKNGFYFLFEIPQYGGEPRFTEAFPYFRVADMIDLMKTYT